MFSNMVFGFHELLYFEIIVEPKFISHVLDDNWFRIILIDLSLNLDGLNEMLL